MDTAVSPPTPAGDNRSKVSKACQTCTKRRTKCTGEEPSCQYCLKMQLDCVYLATVRRGPKKGAKYKQRQPKEAKVEGIEAGSSIVSPTPPREVVASTSTLPALCAVASASASTSTSPPRKRPRSDASNTPVELPTLILPPRIPLPQSRALPSSPTSNLPSIPNLSSEILGHLLPIFFTHINHQGFPILHEPSFIISLARNEISPALLYAIAASASAFSTHPSVRLTVQPYSVTSDSGVLWAKASRKSLLLAVDSQFSLQGVQALTILGCWELAQGCGETAWVDVGAAMRAAQIMGFDDGSDELLMEDALVPIEETLLRRRSVWSLFSLEVILGCGARSISLLGGVTSSVALESLPLPMLGNWEKKEGEELPGDEEEIPTLLVGGGRIMHSLKVSGVEPFLCRAFEIWARLNRYLNLTRIAEASARIRKLAPPVSRHFPIATPKVGLRDWDPASPFARLSLDLSTWSMHLPTPFVFNSTSIGTLSRSQLSSFYTMHLVYHLGQVCLHRPYLADFRYQTRNSVLPGTDGYSVFVNSCHRKAAVHAISLARVLVSATKCASFAISPLAGYCAFTGATALLFDADMKGNSAASQALQFFLRFLLTAADFYSSLRAFHSTLSTLIALHQSITPDPSLAATPQNPSNTVADFFARYEHFGIKEPLLAPIFLRGPSTPRPDPPPPVVQGTTPSAEVDGYLSHLREILAAVDESWEEESKPAVPVPTPSKPQESTSMYPPFTTLYDPFLPSVTGSPLPETPSTTTSTSTSKSTEIETNHHYSTFITTPMSPTDQSPFSFLHSHQTINPFPSPGPPSLTPSSHLNANNNPYQHLQHPSHMQPQQPHQPSYHAQPSLVPHQAHTPPASNDPAEIFTWLFSEPVTDTIWDDQALDGFLGECDWPLFPAELGN